MWNPNESSSRRGRHRGQVSVWYLVLFAVALVIIGILVVRQVRRATTTEVWVARQPIAAGAKVEGGALEKRRVSKDSVPADAVRDPSRFIGRTVSRAVEPGSPLARGDFADKTGNVWLAETLPSGRILATVPFSAAKLPVEQMRKGDRLDVLAITKKGPQLVGHDAFLMGTIRSRGSSGDASNGPGKGFGLVPSVFDKQPTGPRVVRLLLALHPEDVTPLAQAVATNQPLSFALHSQEEVTSGSMLPILTARNSGKVDLITGKRREKVAVNP